MQRETGKSTLQCTFFLLYSPIKSVRGLTRETLVAIETRLWRSKFLSSPGLPPEHPRSSTTDDIECFFSVLRDTVVTGHGVE